MIVKLLLELLALLPDAAGTVSSALNEIHSADPTGAKVAKIGAQAARVAARAGELIDSAASTTEN